MYSFPPMKNWGDFERFMEEVGSIIVKRDFDRVRLPHAFTEAEHRANLEKLLELPNNTDSNSRIALYLHDITCGGRTIMYHEYLPRLAGRVIMHGIFPEGEDYR